MLITILTSFMAGVWRFGNLLEIMKCGALVFRKGQLALIFVRHFYIGFLFLIQPVKMVAVRNLSLLFNSCL